MKKSIFKKALAVLSALTIVSSMAITASAAGEDKNLALGATGYYGGGNGTGGGVVDTITDGITNTTGGVYVNDGGESPYYGVTFAATSSVNKVIYYVESGPSRITDAKVQYLDGDQWTDVSNLTQNLNISSETATDKAEKTIYKSEFTFDTVSTTEIRLVILGKSAGSQCQELEAYYITSDTITAVVSNAGGRSDSTAATATGFLATVTNSGSEDATFNSMDLAVTSGVTTKYFNNKTFADMTLGAGASVYYGIVVDGINDGTATAKAFVK